ncbi:hypothetical protein [Acinetobacter sp. XS-4]|uniref:hypothetical protein n=1 Tax=Acinetobacter sp. XS-4 TaxID=2923375 RepID=UPI00208E1340|nr:hypothetical protein [Acinetobacter sp. XS-4]USP41032.1 hypothetical protein MMY79_02850 [Acinetobacter sp. XS-4]
MKKQELIEKVTGWILAVTLYGTAVFYLVTKVLGITGDDLDAFVGLLGVGATLFGGYMAVYLFTDWKEQHNKTLFSVEAKEALVLINDDIKMFAIASSYIKRLDQNKLATDDSLGVFFDKLSEILNNNIKISVSILILLELSDDKELEEYRAEYNKFISKICSEFIKISRSDKTVKDLVDFMNTNMSSIINFNKSYRSKMKSFIVMK